MKKLIPLVLVLAVFISLVAVGCGKGETETTGTEQAAQSAPTLNITVIESTPAVTEPTMLLETDATIPGGHTITFTEFMSMNGEQLKNLISKFESKEQYDAWLDEIEQDYQDFIQAGGKPQQSDPTEGPTEPEGPIFPDVTDTTAPPQDGLTFLEYHNLSAEEQKAFINTFPSIDAFIAWHTAARKAYEDSLIEIDGTTPIYAGDLPGAN